MAEVKTEKQKRKASAMEDTPGTKHTKAKKKWIVPRHSAIPNSEDEKKLAVKRNVEPGDVGIWVTCDMNREKKALVELRTLFEEHAAKLYGTEQEEKTSLKTKSGKDDIEAEVRRELEELRKPSTNSTSIQLESVRLDTPCLLFFKTPPRIDPVSFVLSFCKEVAATARRRQTQTVKRLTPMSLIGKATEKGIVEVAEQVLAPHFHVPGVAEKKFAIRVNTRNFDKISRETIIRLVAAAVGPGHKVDLKGYDLLILVEMYKNICGISVVTKEYESLKRFNLAEIYAAAPKLSDMADDNYTIRGFE